ncbi:phage tail tube protein [Virgibacillus kimchii]
MARLKNVERKHYVQAYTPGEEEPGEEWLELAKYISNIGDDTNEQTEEEAFYDGDGTEETTVTSVAEAYTPEGYYDPEDPAQELIAGLKRKTGDGRKIWHRVVRSDGKKEWVGRATVTAIVAGAGEASSYETFSCNIRFDRIPEETDLEGTPEG